MANKEILERLKNDDDYYGQFGRKFMSNSDIYNLLKNPTQFRVPQEKTKAMLEGSYFHTKMLEPQKIESFKIIDASSRGTKIYKDACPSGEIMLLTKEKENLDYLCSIMTSNMEMCDYIYATGNEFEVPAVGQIMGLDWKGKADIINHESDVIIDIKTSSDMDKFMYSAKTYNYDSQAYIYQRLFGKQMVFFVIDKSNGKLGIFECSADFIESGQRKVEEAMEIFHKFFSDQATEDISNYIHRQTL
jgi:hypothetical protein